MGSELHKKAITNITPDERELYLLSFDLSDKEKDIMKHMVGFNNVSKKVQKTYLSKGEFYRNRFVANEQHHEWYALESLINKGLMEFTDVQKVLGECRLYYLNEKGLEIVKLLK